MKYLLAFFVLSMITTMECEAQENPVLFTGQVVDNNSPLPGVSINIKGTAKGVISDANGHFKIYASKNDILVITHIGIYSFDLPVTDELLKTPVFSYDITPRTFTAILKSGPSEDELPGFAIPPPPSSAASEIERTYFKSARNLKDVNTILVNALKKAGWGGYRYYRVINKSKKTLNGFMLVAQPGQIKENGSPENDLKRWELQIDTWEKGNFPDYLKSLFHTK